MASAKEVEKHTKSSDDPAGEPDQRIVFGSEPLVRVGLLERYNQLDFRVSGSFTLASLHGEAIYTGIDTDLRWRCKVERSQPARFVYSILVDTCDTREKAERLAERLRQENQPARVLPLGRELQVKKDIVHKGLRWRVIVGAFDRERDARPLLERLNDNTELSPHILRHRIEDQTGEVEVYDAEYDRSAVMELGFRLIPDNDDVTITVYDIRVGVGYHWETQEDRSYHGVLEVRIDNTGNLMAINELPLDEYLRGVIPSEMHHTFPMEALKSQAVAARSYTLAKLASRPASDPIDFPATVNFQVYSGISRQHERTTRAVTETSGEVLKYGNRLCEAYYSSNSGGHTESKVNWAPPGEPYLVGKPLQPKENGEGFELDLTHEEDAARWVRSYPKSYSNPRATGIDILDRNARYFRWEVTYSRRDLEGIIRRKLGFDIGTLVDIQPLQRGVSGRITEIEILGSHRNHKVRGELNIRRVLGESTLYSSCFVVDLTLGDLGDPVEISIIGAGFGHGVGMDQTASGMMAIEGQDYRQILATFYTGAEIEKIW